MIGVLLSALGVDDHDVAADYALTNDYLSEEFRVTLERRTEALGLDRQTMAVLVEAPHELMLRVLKGLRQHHGGAEAYVLDNGLPREALNRLRSALVDP